MHGYEYLYKFLREQNFFFDEEDGYYHFKVNGVTYIAFKNEVPFLQVVISCGAPNVGKLRLLELCNKMNSEKFIIKFNLTPNGQSIWCSYEFIPNEHTDRNDWEIVFNMLDSTSDQLIDEMKKLEEEI